jgi:hypothetical protein
MPGGDRKGPIGNGPMTGRAAGFCAGNQIPGYSNPDNFRYGRGYGFGRGFGRGLGRKYWGRRGTFFQRNFPEPYVSSDISKIEEKSYLENTIKNLEKEINTLHERIKELSKEK